MKPSRRWGWIRPAASRRRKWRELTSRRWREGSRAGPWSRRSPSHLRPLRRRSATARHRRTSKRFRTCTRSRAGTWARSRRASRWETPGSPSRREWARSTGRTGGPAGPFAGRARSDRSRWMYSFAVLMRHSLPWTPGKARPRTPHGTTEDSAVAVLLDEPLGLHGGMHCGSPVRYCFPERDYPSATTCFLDDFEACIAHLQMPIAHRRVTRTTNLLERLFGEERRRTKVIPHAFSERELLKLMFAALIRASETWKNVVITRPSRRSPASRSRISSNHRT